MHLILFDESFFFCTRSDLESLQLVRKSLLNIIVAGSNVLPLCPIGRFDMGYGSEDKIRISVEDPTVADESEPDYEASIIDGNFADTFHRLQHTCIKVFCVGIRDIPFLRYWKAQEADAFVVVSIDFILLETTDYVLLDSIVDHLRPRSTALYARSDSWQENGDRCEYLELLARGSFLHNLQTCRLTRRFSSPTFFDEPGYANYELSYCQAADGIVGLIE
ncbi:hypothetical protein AAVH_32237, partial [Aphelenchoides avenae]